MTQASVAEIVRIELDVRDLGRSVAFYVQGLGFAEKGTTGSELGTSGLRLGAQEIVLRQAPADAAPYPKPRRANDPWFQHFCIAVSDMAAAYEILSAQPHEPISRGGPQHLPPSTGSVTAYKFRDPDGHPLELSHIPASHWVEGEGGTFRGIDHTAFAISDLAASTRFYESMGLQVTGRFLNTGPEQDRLDGLDGVVLDIVSLGLPEGGPHIELLAYREPKPSVPAAARIDNAIAATRTVFRAAEGAQPSRRGLSDPDGHSLAID